MDTYVLKCTQDMRDRTAEIQEILRQQGCCLLEKGIYVVSGVIMPPGTTLAGGLWNAEPPRLIPLVGLIMMMVRVVKSIQTELLEKTQITISCRSVKYVGMDQKE